MGVRTRKQQKLQVETMDDSLKVVQPFLEHKLSKTLRRVLKYTFRTITIIVVLVFSTISISALFILGHACYCHIYAIPFRITVFEIWMLLEAMYYLSEPGSFWA